MRYSATESGCSLYELGGIKGDGCSDALSLGLDCVEDIRLLLSGVTGLRLSMMEDAFPA